MESIIDEITNKYYGCYLYAKRYIKINCNFYFDYEYSFFKNNLKYFKEMYNEDDDTSYSVSYTHLV